MKRKVVRFNPEVVKQALIEWLESRGEKRPPEEAEVRITDDSSGQFFLVKLVWSEDET